MVHAITLRWMLGAVVVETLPVAVALVFGVSQIQAMVPSATMVAAFRDAPAPTAAGVRLLLAGLAALTGGRALREASGPVLPWLRTLPLADGRLALALAPGALLATLPFASFAFLRSPGAGLGTWVASAAAALLVAQGRWGHAGLTWAGASLGPVAFPAVALGLPLLGRCLRDARPGARRPRTARLGRGPVGALLARDLLGVVRLDGWSWVGWLAAAALFAAWLPGQLARSWDPASQAAGTVILVGALGPLPAWILGRAAVALGPALLHRTLPATPAQRLAALLALALLPLLAPALAGLPAGGLRPVALALALASIAVLDLVRRPPERRPNVLGLGVATATFGTLASLSVARPAVDLAVAGVALALAARRIR